MSHPAYDFVNHVALQAKDRAEVQRWYEWLKSQGVDVSGRHASPISDRCSESSRG